MDLNKKWERSDFPIVNNYMKQVLSGIAKHNSRIDDNRRAAWTCRINGIRIRRNPTVARYCRSLTIWFRYIEPEHVRLLCFMRLNSHLENDAELRLNRQCGNFKSVKVCRDNPYVTALGVIRMKREKSKFEFHLTSFCARAGPHYTIWSNIG